MLVYFVSVFEKSLQTKQKGGGSSGQNIYPWKLRHSINDSFELVSNNFPIVVYEQPVYIFRSTYEMPPRNLLFFSQYSPIAVLIISVVKHRAISDISISCCVDVIWLLYLDTCFLFKFTHMEVFYVSLFYFHVSTSRLSLSFCFARWLFHVKIYVKNLRFPGSAALPQIRTPWYLEKLVQWFFRTVKSTTFVF